jgi:hypothetical protein
MERELVSVSASELAYILSTTQEKANKIIGIKLFNDHTQAELECKLNKNLRIDISRINGLFVIDVEQAIIDIRENAMSRPHFKKWLLSDYPLEKLRVEYPKRKIRLPRGLRSMLKKSDLDEIEFQWKRRYQNTTFPQWHESVDYYPILKP